MTPEFVARAKQDYDNEKYQLDWDSYLAGYWAAVKRFSENRKSRRETKSELGYSIIDSVNI